MTWAVRDNNANKTILVSISVAQGGWKNYFSIFSPISIPPQSSSADFIQKTLFFLFIFLFWHFFPFFFRLSLSPSPFFWTPLFLQKKKNLKQGLKSDFFSIVEAKCNVWDLLLFISNRTFKRKFNQMFYFFSLSDKNLVF